MVDVFFNSTYIRHSYRYLLCTSYSHLFFYPYQTNFIQRILKKNGNKLDRSFNFSVLYIDDILSLNSSKSGDFFDRIYSIELQIMDIIYTTGSTLYPNLHLKFDGNDGLRTTHYDKRDYLNFSIASLSFICRNIPAAH